ncbi:alpha/beta hydrolase [Aminobacter sp. LjRoot7]|uniref:alpha/beta hydrolase n=1 Tax=Aminobacter sp. LjRoot7 TaxID=3342335 RepID=UPI003ED14CEA
MSKDSYIHKLLPGEPGSPLIFAFHGTGGDENQFLGFARELVPGATVVSPRGDVSEMGAARFFRRTGEGVYDMDDLIRATSKMAGFVKAHIAAAKPSQVLALGYSNGANILASVLFAEPALFDAVALMHPLIPFAPEVKGSLAGRQVLVTAGRRDPICPPELTTRLDAYLRQAGADVSLEWHDGGHEVRPNEIEAVKSLFASATKGAAA